jgi:hypothetical protein
MAEAVCLRSLPIPAAPLTEAVAPVVEHKPRPIIPGGGRTTRRKQALPRQMVTQERNGHPEEDIPLTVLV